MERDRDPFRRPISPESLAAQITLLEKAVAGAEGTLGPKHPDTLAARGDLANGYVFAGRFAEAITLHEQNRPICEDMLGPDHADTMQSRDVPGGAYRSAGRARLGAHRARLPARRGGVHRFACRG
jgi:hypothetical protein